MTTTAERMAEVMPRLFDALERVDLEDAMAVVEETCHPDCELTSGIGSRMDGRTYRGHDGVRAWLADLLDAAELTYGDRECRIVGDDALLFLARVEIKGRGSGAEVSQAMGTLFEYEDGLCRRAVTYRSQAEVLAAVEAIHA